jgi:leucyl aminopeptidase
MKIEYKPKFHKTGNIYYNIFVNLDSEKIVGPHGTNEEYKLRSKKLVSDIKKMTARLSATLDSLGDSVTHFILHLSDSIVAFGDGSAEDVAKMQHIIWKFLRLFLPWKHNPDTTIIITHTSAKHHKSIEDFVKLTLKMRDARLLAMTPANLAYPANIVAHFKKVFESIPRARISVINYAGLKKGSFNLILAVGESAVNKPELFIVDRPSKKQGGKKICIVGKGITFDSGGLSIKGISDMMDMKFDKIGACYGAYSLAHLIENSEYDNVHFIGIFPLAENAVSGRSVHPGDVIKSYLGKTVEITDPDAEGRLVLADAFGYAHKYKPDLIIDIATLTGHAELINCWHSGYYYAFPETLKTAVEKLSYDIGEPMLPMPTWDDHDDILESTVADFVNDPRDCSDAFTATLFMKQFIPPGAEWLHIDLSHEFDKHVPRGNGIRTIVATVEWWLGNKTIDGGGRGHSRKKLDWQQESHRKNKLKFKPLPPGRRQSSRQHIQARDYWRVNDSPPQLLGSLAERSEDAAMSIEDENYVQTVNNILRKRNLQLTLGNQIKNCRETVNLRYFDVPDLLDYQCKDDDKRNLIEYTENSLNNEQIPTTTPENVANKALDILMFKFNKSLEGLPIQFRSAGLPTEENMREIFSKDTNVLKKFYTFLLPEHGEIPRETITTAFTKPNCCYICGKIFGTEPLETDHIIPVGPAYVLGLLTFPLNFIQVHATCNNNKNNGKGDRVPEGSFESNLWLHNQGEKEFLEALKNNFPVQEGGFLYQNKEISEVVKPITPLRSQSYRKKMPMDFNYVIKNLQVILQSYIKKFNNQFVFNKNKDDKKAAALLYSIELTYSVINILEIQQTLFKLTQIGGSITGGTNQIFKNYLKSIRTSDQCTDDTSAGCCWSLDNRANYLEARYMLYAWYTQNICREKEIPILDFIKQRIEDLANISMTQRYAIINAAFINLH